MLVNPLQISVCFYVSVFIMEQISVCFFVSKAKEIVYDNVAKASMGKILMLASNSYFVLYLNPHAHV